MTSDQRRGGRAARRAERLSAPIIQKRYLTREIPLYELLDASGIEVIHQTSMTILEEIGVEFRDDDALAYWRAAGAQVDGSRVRIPRELAMEHTFLPTPVYLCEFGGKVVINITVDRNGNVIDAYVNSSSISSNGCLIDSALEYAKASSFNSDNNKPSQLGTITFYFKGKS